MGAAEVSSSVKISYQGIKRKSKFCEQQQEDYSSRIVAYILHRMAVKERETCSSDEQLWHGGGEPIPKGQQMQVIPKANRAKDKTPRKQ